MAVKKKIPMRKCVGCGEMKPKKELMRILRTESGEFIVDAAGKKNGRGAYICRSVECFRQAVRSKGLERSFTQEIPQEVYDKLEKEMGEIEAEG
ncbi:MAG TPA: YlxR family protein [Candidatus Mediterraneibacter pullistercoris]|nr:YlxR family protein [Candidatus Mediterraneibacter pullistercoris]